MKKLLLAMILFLSATITANAATLNTDVDKYIFEKVNSSCVSTYIDDARAVALIDDKVLYTDEYYEKFVFVTKDGTCDTNVTMSDASKAREKLNVIGTFLQEEGSKTYAVESKYSIWVTQFEDKVNGGVLELTHYDQTTLIDGIDYYKREHNPLGADYAVKVDPSDLTVDDIFLYYYDKDGVYEIQNEKITELSNSMKTFAENRDGYFAKSPREKRVFYVGIDNEDKLDILSDEDFLIFDSIDDFSFIESYLFFVVKDNEGRITDRINTYHTMNNVSSSNVIDADNNTVLLTITYTDDSVETYVIETYKIDAYQNVSHYRDSDFEIEFENGLEELDELYNGTEVIPSTEYEVKLDSSKIVIKKSYLDTLVEGTYEIKAVFNNGIELSLEIDVIDPVSVTLDANGGLFSGDKETYTYDEWQWDTLANIVKPTKEGYKFVGYYTTKDTGGMTLERANLIGIENDTIFYARWEKIVTNPETFDNIHTNVIMFIISMSGLVASMIYYKKFKKEVTN